LRERHQLGDATCPKTPAELASRLRTVARRRPGQPPGLALRLERAVQPPGAPILQKLERLSERPLLDGQYFGDSATGGTVQLVQGSEGAATVTEIAVNRRAGCLLLAL
jgi:hypothetical protein